MIFKDNVYIMEHNYKVKDATSFSIDLIVELVNNQYLSYFNINKDKTKDDYYCGITNNLDKRMEEHRCEDFEIVEDRVFAWNCENVDVATEVEKRLGKLGFDIGISRLWIKKNIYRVLLILCRPL